MILFLALFFVILVACNASFEVDGSVIVLTDRNFDEALESFESIMIEFYAPWCGYCQDLAPEYDKAAAIVASSHPHVKVAKLDSTEYQQIADNHEISGLPTIRFFRKGKKLIDYNGFRNGDDISSWVISQSKAGIQNLMNKAELEIFEKDNDIYVLGLLFSLKSKTAKKLESWADDDPTRAYAYSDATYVKEKFGVTQDTIIIYSKGNEQQRTDITDFSDFVKIKELIRVHTTPLVFEFSEKSVQTIFRLPIKIHVILFSSEEDVEETAKALTVLKSVAEINKDRAVFLNILSKHQQIHNMFSLTSESLPRFFLVDGSNPNGGEIKYPFDGDVSSAEEINEFVSKFFKGELPIPAKSEELSPEDTEDSVIVVKNKSYDELVVRNPKSVFILLYSPMSGESQKLAPIWDELGDKYESNPDIAIAKIDITANDVVIGGYQVTASPSIYFYSVSDKGNPSLYDGQLELDEFVSYLEKHNVRDEL